MHGVRQVALVHRLGRLEVGETSVLIAVSSAHRAQAFEACRWLIDTLKKTVPIWKKEHFEDGAVWADGEPFPPELLQKGHGCEIYLRDFAARLPSAASGRQPPGRWQRLRRLGHQPSVSTSGW